MKYASSQEFISKLNNLFNGLIALPLLLVGFGYLQISSGLWTALMEGPTSLIGAISIGILLLITYLSLRFKKEARNVTVFKDLQEMMDAYFRLASFYYWSIFAMSLMATVMLFLFAHMAFTIVYAYGLFWLSVFRPTIRSLADLFDLKDDDKKTFLNKEPFEVKL